MRIVYIGGGFVGTCSAAAAADSGHVVCVYDIDVEKMRLLGSGDHEAIMSCLFEQGLSDLLIRHRERIAFTSELTVLQESLEDAEAIVMCLPTPEIGETGASDMPVKPGAQLNSWTVRMPWEE